MLSQLIKSHESLDNNYLLADLISRCSASKLKQALQANWEMVWTPFQDTPHAFSSKLTRRQTLSTLRTEQMSKPAKHYRDGSL